MINTVKAAAAASLNQRSPRRDPEERPHEPPKGASGPVEGSVPEADLRLVIERDSDNADFVYRLIDRATGRVVAELPRDQVSKLASEPTYEAGGLVSTKA